MKPLHLSLEFTRARAAQDLYAFETGTQPYLLRLGPGRYRHVELSWDQDLLDALLAVRQPDASPELLRGLGNRLRQLLEPAGWAEIEAAVLGAVRAGRHVRLHVIPGAAELYALPWEAVRCRATDESLDRLPGCTITYEWPGTIAARPAPPAAERALLAWSGEGGRVRPRAHIDGLVSAHGASAVEVLPHVMLDSLRATLQQATDKRRPITVLEILCHGLVDGDGAGLIWGTDHGDVQVVRAEALQDVLAPFSATLRLVVISACTGASVVPGGQLGGLAQVLHRGTSRDGGIRAVLASRYPLSQAGAATMARTFHVAEKDGLLGALKQTQQALRDEGQERDGLGLHLLATAKVLYPGVVDWSTEPGDGTAESTAPRHNLPAPVGRFVGRGQELEQLGRMLELPAGTVIIEGQGGVGKTRLAHQLALGQLDQWPGGVWAVALPDWFGVEVAVADVLGVALASADVLQEVGAELSERGRVLIILDAPGGACDPALPTLDQLCDAAPEARFLVIQERAPGADGLSDRPDRQVLRVGPLPVPDGLGGGLDTAAVALYCASARSWRPSFVVDSVNRAAVLELVRHVGGVPLALELAAAVPSPAQLGARLGRDFRVDLEDAPDDAAAVAAALERHEQSWHTLYLEAAAVQVDEGNRARLDGLIEAVEALLQRAESRRLATSGKEGARLASALGPAPTDLSMFRTMAQAPDSLVSHQATPRASLMLAILWSRSEPGRVGEVFVLPTGDGPWVIGRAHDGAGPEALAPVRRRPWGDEPQSPLQSRRLSRRQLVVNLEPGGLRIENAGTAALRINGEEQRRASVIPGDVVEVHKELLLLCVERVEEPVELDLDRHPFGQPDVDGLAGETPALWRLRARIDLVAESEGHLLLVGPSGAGQDLVAAAIHRSVGGETPLVVLTDVTSPELRQAAVTGQTVFVDDLGGLSVEDQSQLRSVFDASRLPDPHDDGVGATCFRFIGAVRGTADPLDRELSARLTRRIQVPGLHERREDIPLLARQLLAGMAQANPKLFPGGTLPRLHPHLVRALVLRDYATHLRELESLLWQAVEAWALAGRGKYLDIPLPIAPRRTICADPSQLTREDVQEAYRQCGGVPARVVTWLRLGSQLQLNRVERRLGMGLSGPGPRPSSP